MAKRSATYHDIIIGTGSAGCVMANQLEYSSADLYNPATYLRSDGFSKVPSLLQPQCRE